MAVSGLPFLLRDSSRAINVHAADTVVILSGHNENVRFELGQGFQRWYKEKTGRTVFVDWRFLGGVVEIVRYLESVYSAAFRYHWEHELGLSWTSEVQQIFGQRTEDRSRWDTPLKKEVCGTFYDSKISSAIDLFFGGGVSEFAIQADRGALVDCGFLGEHPELFNGDVIPAFLAGEHLWDPNGRWFGQVLSTFGILYNREAIAALGLRDEDICQWWQLADPKLFGAIALVDPTKSSAVLKAYEMVVQQQIALCLEELQKQTLSGEHGKKTAEQLAIREGWLRGLRLLQLISANTRYYADTPTKMILDISSGNSAAGPIVDAMGNAQVDFDRQRCGWERLAFVLPQNGSAISPDPIGILRGAPNESVAKLFLEYVLGESGQKVVAFAVGAPGGPVRNALFRPPVNRKIYAADYASCRSFQGDPFQDLAACDFHPERTASIYNALKWTVKFAFMIPHRELVEAWNAILKAREEGRTAAAETALELLQDFSEFAFDEVNVTLATMLRPDKPALALEAQRQLVRRFQKQYREARRIAEGHHTSI
ncbi:MAG: extracellular solute-binding protein [Puniceicoccales bacterium]|nr:extracellular solute-binding protein [Puniceicoccales bacterium]